MKLFVLLIMVWTQEDATVHTIGIYSFEKECQAMGRKYVEQLYKEAPKGIQIHAGCAMFQKEEVI